MTQRMALILAGAITAFIIVLLGGVLLTVRLSANAQAVTNRQPAISQPSTATSVPSAQLTAEQAAQVALNTAPGARLAFAPELVNLNGTVAYQVTLDQGIVYVDAGSGRVLHSTLSTLTDASPRGERHFEEEHEHEGDDD